MNSATEPTRRARCFPSKPDQEQRSRGGGREANVGPHVVLKVFLELVVACRARNEPSCFYVYGLHDVIHILPLLRGRCWYIYKSELWSSGTERERVYIFFYLSCGRVTDSEDARRSGAKRGWLDSRGTMMEVCWGHEKRDGREHCWLIVCWTFSGTKYSRWFSKVMWLILIVGDQVSRILDRVIALFRTKKNHFTVRQTMTPRIPILFRFPTSDYTHQHLHKLLT